MEGGIRAWKGLTAKRTPEAGITYFAAGATAKEMVALAWFLENGSRRFYDALAHALEDHDAAELHRRLASAEERHKATLLDLYKKVVGAVPDPAFPKSVISAENDDDVMEGGMRVTEALQWVKGKSVTEVLELSVALETNSYDLYLNMERRLKDQPSAEVFGVLSGEEKEHLERLSTLLEKRLP
ncbi:MAG TPA: ferritin family protein [Desulfatiglandales bacterium]|nr:ferritin family protein [Desulfatiglandales bacterium]